MLHLITCHRRIMPRLAELLLSNQMDLFKYFRRIMLKLHTTIDFPYIFYTFYIFSTAYNLFCFKFKWSIIGTCPTAVPMIFSKQEINGKL